MEIIEDSNIVNWDDFPDYVCAIVMQTTKDITTSDGFICPKGEEFTWLLDKAPTIDGDTLHIHHKKINPLGGIAFEWNGWPPADALELHYKPKSKCNIYNELESCLCV